MENVLFTQLTIPELRQIFRQELNVFFTETQPNFHSPAASSIVWLSLNELCVYLPEKPAKQTVYTWVSNQITPFHKKGKKLYFLKSEIDEWLKSGRRRTTTEIAVEAVNLLNKIKKG